MEAVDCGARDQSVFAAVRLVATPRESLTLLCSRAYTIARANTNPAGQPVTEGCEVAQWWCLQDAFCCSLLAAIGVAAVTVFRRLSTIQSSHRRERWTVRAVVAYCLVGALLSGSAGLSVSIVACELWPQNPRLVMGLVVLTGYSVDLTTSSTRKVIWATLRDRVLAVIDAITKGRDS